MCPHRCHYADRNTLPVQPQGAGQALEARTPCSRAVRSDPSQTASLGSWAVCSPQDDLLAPGVRLFAESQYGALGRPLEPVRAPCSGWGGVSVQGL